MRRELHIVYGQEVQGWEETATGWHQVDPDDWPRDSYIVVEWPLEIPSPVYMGPPRELW